MFSGWGAQDGIVCSFKENPNYFFIDETDHERAANFLSQVTIESGDYIYANSRTKMCKCSFDSDKIMRVARNILEAYGISVREYLETEKRARIDNRLQVPVNGFKYAATDIEVDARFGFPDPKIAKYRILGVAIVGSDGKKVFITDDDEKTLLKRYFAALIGYRLVTGWNLTGFDCPYIFNRAKLHGLDYHIPGVSWVDALKLYRSTDYARGKSCRLDDTAERELKRIIKKDFDTLNKMQEMWNWFITHDRKLALYCLADTQAAFDIATSEKLRLFDGLIEKANLSFVDYEEVMYPSRMVEAAVLSKAGMMNPRVVFPSANKFDKERESFEGGHVLEPQIGLWSNVVCFDFRGMYPSVMRTWNIGLDSFLGTDSKVEHISTPDGKQFSLNPSVNRQLLEELDIVRSFHKKLESTSVDANAKRIHYVRQNALKVLTLSVFGVLGLSSSRLFSKPVVECITACGRWLLGAVEKHLRIDDFKQYKPVMIYGDTDSVFVSLTTTDYSKLINEIIPEVTTKLNQSLRKNILEQFNVPEVFYCVEVEFRELYSKFYIPAKKRYIGQIVYKSVPCMELFTRGFEIAKFSAFDLYKEIQKGLFKIIFECDDAKIMAKQGAKYMENIKNKLFDGELDDKLVLRTGVQSLPSEYKSNQPYIRVAQVLQQQGLFRVGDIVKYVIAGNDKASGVLRAEPVIDKVPHILNTGYMHYWDCIKTFYDECFEKCGGISSTKLTDFMGSCSS